MPRTRTNDKSPPKAWLTAALAVSLGACPQPKPTDRGPPKPLRIGVVGALTGPNATYGTAAKYGVDLAIRQANEAGGIRGRRIEALHVDDESKPHKAKEAAERLIAQDGVVALLGESTSDCALAMAPVAQRARRVMISPAATLPAVTEIGDFVFRACFDNEAQGKAIASHATGTLELTRFAILRDANSNYASQLAKSFETAVTSQGGKVVANEVYGGGDADFSKSLDKMGEAQALFVPGYHADIVKIARAVKAKGLKLVLLGGDGWGAREVRTGAAAAVEGAYYTDHFHAAGPTTEAGFLKRYKELYNELPSPVAAMAYDSARLLLDALSRAGNENGEAVRDALMGARGLSGAFGPLDMQQSRAPRRSVVIVQIRDGQPQFSSAVSPKN